MTSWGADEEGPLDVTHTSRHARAVSAIAERLDSVRARIASALERTKRVGGVRLIAVSKGHPASAVREAYSAGQRDFGENYVQELGEKRRELHDTDIAWHFVGHLQRNKVKDVVPHVTMIHTVDRAELAAEIAKRAARNIEVLLEVNIGREPQKAGCDPDRIVPLARAVAGSEKLSLRGLMCVPPASDDAAASRPHFRALRESGLRLVEAGLVRGTLELSMGMSHDFEVAIEEGATLVRVGTDIFGQRALKVAPPSGARA